MENVGEEDIGDDYVDPDVIALAMALLAANSGLWRVLDHYVLNRAKCGSTACNKAVVNELEKKLTRNGREPV